MDISNLTVQELKAMAYDEMIKLETSQQNLTLLNRRIAELNQKKAQAIENNVPVSETVN